MTGLDGGSRLAFRALSSTKSRLDEGRWKRQQEKNRQDQAEVDRILDKVRDQGLQSLSRKEKKALAKATERQRRAG